MSHSRTRFCAFFRDPAVNRGTTGSTLEERPIAEVTTSSASYALHDELRSYQRNGVCEYVVWRVWDEAIDWFVLREGRFERLSLDDAGRYRSEIFPGLRLDPAA